jgi:MFS transporter, FHS family, L-fucose permease
LDHAGATIPELQAFLADRIGIHHAFILPVLCYAYILFYSRKGASTPRQQPA